MPRILSRWDKKATGYFRADGYSVMQRGDGWVAFDAGGRMLAKNDRKAVSVPSRWRSARTAKTLERNGIAHFRRKPASPRANCWLF